jgi:acyl dehydratase
MSDGTEVLPDGTSETEGSGTPRTLTGVEAIKAAVGEQIGLSDWMLIDQQRVNTFADATGDHQWIHIDAERARSGPFGATVAHGFLTLSLLAGLSQRAYDFAGFSMKINYGLDRVRFVSPVRVGSRLRLRAVLTSAEDTPKGLRVRVHATIELEGSETVACVADSISLLVP